MPYIIDDSSLDWLSTCERHLWLDGHKQVEPESPAPPYLYHQATSAESWQTTSVSDWPDAIQQTRQLMAQGVLSILGGCLSATLPTDDTGTPIVYRAQFDRLNRVDLSQSLVHQLWYRRTGRAYLYVPVIVTSLPELNDLQCLQMDCHISLLEHNQQIRPSTAEFWVGQDAISTPHAIINHQHGEDRLEEMLIRATQLMLNQTYEPQIVIESYCKRCRWEGDCRRQAVSTKSVSLLRLHRETRTHFQQAGIISLQQVIDMSEETLISYRYVGKKTARKIRSQAIAFHRDAPIWLQDVPDICQQSGWFFDIETNPQTNHIWSIGWAGLDSDTRIVIVVPHRDISTLRLPDGRQIITAPDTDSAWRVFCEGVSRDEQPIFSWTSFDSGNMRAYAPHDVTQQLDSRMQDLYAGFKNTIQIPTRSNSLKVVAPFAGFQWRGYQDWSVALRDYQMYLHTDDASHLIEACHYQAGDVEAMIAIWHWINQTSDNKGVAIQIP